MDLTLHLPASLLVFARSRASFDSKHILDGVAQQKLEEQGRTSIRELCRLQGRRFTRFDQKLLVPMSQAVFPGCHAGFLVKNTGKVAV